MGIDSNFELEARLMVSVVVLLALLGPFLNGCAVMSVPVAQQGSKTRCWCEDSWGGGPKAAGICLLVHLRSVCSI